MMMTCNTRVATLLVNMYCAENKYGMWMVCGSNRKKEKKEKVEKKEKTKRRKVMK